MASRLDGIQQGGRTLKPIVLAVALSALAASCVQAGTWDETLAKARGQTVYWNAWGGDERTNSFIAWVGERTEAAYGVSIKQVKLTDTAEAVSRVVAEKAAGQTEGGSVDLIWINGANFQSMKEQGLLYGPFLSDLPNSARLDLSPGAAAVTDFTIPTEGYESPWRLAKFVFQHDSARLAEPPRSMTALLDWAEANPGRFTHPSASNFMGATFLKQALIELAADPAALAQPATDEIYAATVQPLWDWYGKLRPALWREGREFPENASILEQMLNDGVVDMSMSFDPASAAASIEAGLLPETVRTFTPDVGAIGNISFVAIPFNAAHRDAAMVVANELLAPEVQARAQDIRVLGSYTVLDPSRLSADEAALFDGLPSSPALPTLAELGATLTEPHPSWMTRLAEDWKVRVAE
jgi:putative thiamine transport system substrate-binding protein